MRYFFNLKNFHALSVDNFGCHNLEFKRLEIDKALYINEICNNPVNEDRYIFMKGFCVEKTVPE